MKAPTLILVMFTTFASCTNKSTVLHCDQIEVSYSNGMAPGTTTISLNKDGAFKECHYTMISGINDCKCYRDTIAEEFISRINSLVDSLHLTRVDTMYSEPFEDRSSFHIDITYPERKISTTINSPHDTDMLITRFGLLVLEIPCRGNYPDTCEVFETTKKMVPPKTIIEEVFFSVEDGE